MRRIFFVLNLLVGFATEKMMPVIVQSECYINFGKPDQKRKVLTLQLDDVKQTFDVGVIDVQ